MPAARLTILMWSPRAISLRSAPFAIRDVTSDSANTVHMLLMVKSFLASSAARPNSSMENPRFFAIISMNLPVPAAQRSFISNFLTRPFLLRLMALLSCPPISSMVSASLKKACTPLAWAFISVTVSELSKSISNKLRPYPVAMILSYLAPFMSFFAFAMGSKPVSVLKFSIILPFSSTTSSIVLEPISIPAYFILFYPLYMAMGPGRTQARICPESKFTAIVQ